ncbi:MAG: type II secretion system protein [Patescibacteria group bacterium]
MQAPRGFTLIELLVVVGIVGILAALILAFLNDGREKSRDSARAADIKQLQIALSLYFDDRQLYPTALKSLAPQYIPVLPNDPTTHIEYPYDRISTTKYHLGANLEQAHVNLLRSDVDATTTKVFGSDSTGCAGEVNLHCYDVNP